jgi:Flp pilus assembly protein TadG
MSQRRGASALEFALTLPIVMAVLAGILEYGWYLFQLSNVVHALRDGTRIGVTVPLDDDEGPSARAEAHARAVLDGLGVPCTESGGCAVTATIGPSGDISTLTTAIAVDYTPIVGMLPTPSQLSGTFTMMMVDQGDE